MMKTSLFSAIFLLAVNIASAQPVLDRVDMPLNVPVQFGIGATTNAGAAGANVTWDFSKLSVSNAGSFKSITPSTSPYYSTYPTSNFVIEVNTGSPFYNHYNMSNSKFEWIGYRMGLANINLSPDPIIFMNFPFRYNDKFIDTVKSTDGSYDEVDTIMYDGYGTLKTPYGTYSNAVRIKRWNASETTWEWYIADPAYFTYAILQITSASTRIFKAFSTGIENVVPAKTVAAIYPNPTNGNIQVTLPVAKATLTIHDLKGTIVARYTVADKQSIQLNTLPAGTYTYHIADEHMQDIGNGRLALTR